MERTAPSRGHRILRLAAVAAVAVAVAGCSAGKPPTWTYAPATAAPAASPGAASVRAGQRSPGLRERRPRAVPRAAPRR